MMYTYKNRRGLRYLSTRFLFVTRRNRGISANSLSRDRSRLGYSSLEGIGLGDMVLGDFGYDHDSGFRIYLRHLGRYLKKDQATVEGAENDKLVRTVPIP